MGRPIVIALFMPLVSIITGTQTLATMILVSVGERFVLPIISTRAGG